MARRATKRNSSLNDETVNDDAPRQEQAQETNKLAVMGGNIKGLHDDIRLAYEEIEQLKKERKAINDQIKAKREVMEAKGITKNAFDDAMAYINSTPEKREGYDTAYIIAREALGAPVKGAQADLFGDPVTDATEEENTDDE